MKIAFDIGSNKGDFTEYFLKSGFDKVVAVEANSELAQKISERFSSANVIVVNKTVSNTVGQPIDFYICNADGISTADEAWRTTGRFTLDPYHKWTKIQSESITIDELAKLYGYPNHIKLDIEGYEPVALMGISVPYCPIRFEYTEERLDEIEIALHHLASIGYYYFGDVVEDKTNKDGSFNCDQRPKTYFKDITELISQMKKGFEVSRQINMYYPTPNLAPDQYIKNLKKMIFWGMIWCFRQSDGPKLNLAYDFKWK